MLIGIGRPKLSTLVILIGAGANLVLNLLMIPAWGIYGAALATLLSYLIILVLSIWKIHPFISLDIPLMSWAKIIGSGLAFLAVIYGLKSMLSIHPWAEAIITVIVALVVYTALLWIFNIFEKKEIRHLFFWQSLR